MATSGMTTSPQVLSAASRCPYIQQVVADVGDPQTVSNSLAPFLSLATAVTGATGVAAAQPSASGSAGADPSAPVVGASGGEVSEEAITASTAATAEKPAEAAA
ncbi:hypothetical protein COCOBI_07-0880 [Coccomyxa sp. Obi]|nr:hypothetical protein COCOBI_07-0880 [Coccomyxa sp. Obi]